MASADGRADERRLAFLDEANRVLASSLDYTTTLQNLARLMVPELADCCLIDMIGSGGLDHVAAVCADPAEETHVAELVRRHPPPFERLKDLTRALGSGRSYLLSEIPDTYWEAVAEDADHLQEIRALGFVSQMVVPLIARGQTLGTITLLRRSARERYGDTDVAFAEDIARRAGLAVDNARLYRAAEETRALLDAVIQQMPEGVIIAEAPSGRILMSNARVDEIARGPLVVPRGVEEYAVWEGFHPDGRPYRKEEWPLARALLNGETVRGEEVEVVRLGDRSRATVRIHAAPIRDAAGRTVAAVLVFDDITERKRREREREIAALRIQAAQVITEAALGHPSMDRLLATASGAARTALDAAAAGIWLLEPEGRHLHVGATEGADVAATDRIPLGEGLVGRIAATGTPMVGGDAPPHEAWGPFAGGELRALAGAPLRVERRVIGVLLVGRLSRRFDSEELQLLQVLADRASLAIDNVELYERERRARLAAEAANRAKDEFLAVVSHELRTPLSPILAWSRLLQETGLPERPLRAMRTIERNAIAQARIIDDLLDVSRIVTGKLRLQVELVDMPTIVAGAIEAVRPAAEARGVELVSRLDPGAGWISGDPDRLQQIAWNLLSNAVKFTERGGRIEVKLTRTADHAELAVRDTGQGIDPDLLRRMFEPFEQADRSSTRRHGGLGLGLAIVRRLVELHGGSVDADSAGPGRGAVFTVRLPLAASAAAARSEPSPRPEGETPAPAETLALDGVRIVVVDDERDTNDVVAAILEARGATVRSAESVAEALELIARWPPDVVVSDIAMPGADGYALVRAIRSQDERAVPAVALTAYARAEDRRKALAAGFQVHVAKPIEPTALVSAVASVLRRSPAASGAAPDPPRRP